VAKLAAPYLAKGTGGRRGLSSSPFNEGVSVPRADWDRLARDNPALESRDRKERSAAIEAEVLGGALAPYRRR